jgi:glutathione S-transferase
MMILHHGWRSSASRRVRLCLAEKGLAYEGHVVDMTAMEHHSPEYLRINPLGVIPALIHDGRPLHESGTICEYLDEAFPAPRSGRMHLTSAPRCATGSGTSTG